MKILNSKSPLFCFNQLFIKAVVENSTEAIFDLAEIYYNLHDYSASIALCTLNISKMNDASKNEKYQSLILLSSNLNKCKLAKKVHLRPLAIAMLENRKVHFVANSRIYRDYSMQFDLFDITILFFLLLKMIFFEKFGFFPKSVSTVVRKIFYSLNVWFIKVSRGKYS